MDRPVCRYCGFKIPPHYDYLNYKDNDFCTLDCAVQYESFDTDMTEEELIDDIEKNAVGDYYV